MAITTNQVYDAVAKAVRAEYPKAFTTSVKQNIPSSFPCVEIVEIDTYPERYATALDFSDTQRRSVFEVQTFSNKANGASTEARAIIELVTAKFRTLGYRCMTQAPVVNAADSTIQRYVARYTRVIGGGDTLS